MANNNIKIENLLDNDSDIKIVNKQNLSTSWIKFGEIFYNKFGEPKFVCLVCLEKADSTSSAYTTSDSSVLWWHIQQHISLDSETIQKESAEIKSFEDNNVKQNQLKLLEEFHESLVKSNAAKDNKEIFHNLDINKENQQVDENYIKSEFKEQNENNDCNFSNCNYYYNENEKCTISDDETDYEEDGNQELPGTDSELTVANYLKHNDMIEISDDEEIEDDVEMEENAFRLLNEKSNLNEGVDSVGKNKCINSNNVEESILSKTNLVISIPTPDVSPCESLTDSNYSAFNNHSMPLSEEVQDCSKNRVTPFKAIQCKVCGIRTINERNMRIHLQRFHKPLLDNNRSYKFYYQVYQSHPKKQQDRASNDRNGQKNPFKCKYCRIRTKTEESMKRHQRLYHSPDSHLILRQCEICRRHILTEKLQQHVETHLKSGFNSEYWDGVYNQNYILNNRFRNFNDINNLQPQEFAINFNAPTMSYESSSLQSRLTSEEEQQFMYQEYEQIYRNPFDPTLIQR